ncbi:MAG: hypothetical protein GY703_05520 [Gammaproteobacteria bacterium]|nr:hypothetical protein [Gammaproteobacteria bacterium]
MKYLQAETHIGANDCATDAETSSRVVELHLQELEQQIAGLGEQAPLEERLKLTMDKCYSLLEANLRSDAWSLARDTLDQAVTGEIWLRAVECCDVMFQSEQPDALKALAHGIWLGVTFPVDPELSVAMLQHLIDDSPDRSDGSAVAAATACYLVQLRAQGKQHDDLVFFSNQLLGQVARRHSQVEDQEIFDFWVQQLQLDDPGQFLPRLARVLDVINGEQWWFDRDRLRGKLPEAG